MQSELTIKVFFYLIKKRIIMICVTAAIVMTITACVLFFFLKPMYEAKEYILIGNLESKNIENAYEETQKIPRVMASSIDVIKSPIVGNTVKKELGLKDVSIEEKMLIENNRDSQVITIIVKNQDAELAKKIASTTATTSIEKINTFLKFSQAKILVENDSIVKKNNITARIAIVLIVGVFSGIGLAIILEQLDDSIKSEKMVEDLLNLPLLGKFDSENKVKQNRRNLPLDKERRKFSVKEKKKEANRAPKSS